MRKYQEVDMKDKTWKKQSQVHAQTVYAWALEEHYRQAKKHANRQKK